MPGSQHPTRSERQFDTGEHIMSAAKQIEKLQAEVELLRAGYCDEAYILMVQALDVKSLAKCRKRILTEQARRMARVGLSRGWPRPTNQSSRARLHELAADVLARLGDGDV